MPSTVNKSYFTTTFRLLQVLGPRLMENRKPMQLKNALIIYNLFQVIFSTWLFYEVSSHILATSKNIFSPSFPPQITSITSLLIRISYYHPQILFNFFFLTCASILYYSAFLLLVFLFLTCIVPPKKTKLSYKNQTQQTIHSVLWADGGMITASSASPLIIRTIRRPHV